MDLVGQIFFQPVLNHVIVVYPMHICKSNQGHRVCDVLSFSFFTNQMDLKYYGSNLFFNNDINTLYKKLNADTLKSDWLLLILFNKNIGVIYKSS